MSRTLIYLGAHHGNTLAGLIRDFDLIFAFEPNPACVEILHEKFDKWPNVRIKPYAVGAEDGQATFHRYCPDDGSGSLGIMTAKARDLMQPGRTPGFFDERESFKVPVVNLPRWLKENGIDRINFLISDCQGMDLTILRTLKPMLMTSAIDRFQAEVDHDDVSHYETIPTNSRAAWADYMSRFPRYVTAGLGKWDVADDVQHDVTWINRKCLNELMLDRQDLVYRIGKLDSEIRLTAE